LKDFYGSETETSHQSINKPQDLDKNKPSTDSLNIVRKICPKCESQRAYETNRVSITKKILFSEESITRYKCVKCGHSWIIYEKCKD